MSSRRMKGGEWAGLGERLGGRGLVGAPLASAGILTESTSFSIFWSETSTPGSLGAGGTGSTPPSNLDHLLGPGE